MKPAIAQRRTLSLRGGALRRALRRGVTLRLSAPGAGTLSARASLGARLVAAGSKRTKRAGTVPVKLRFSARGRRALKHLRTARLVVRTTFRAQ